MLWLHDFPRFLTALCTGYMFSRALDWLQGFPHFAPATRFGAKTCVIGASSDWLMTPFVSDQLSVISLILVFDYGLNYAQ